MEFNPSEIIMLLFATIGPLKVTIVCATLTAGASPDFLKRVAFRSVLIALIVCIVFAVLGEAILNLFKVSVPAFQIGGGIIVLLFSLDMVIGDKKGGKDGPSGSPETEARSRRWTSRPTRSRFRSWPRSRGSSPSFPCSPSAMMSERCST